MIPLNIPNAYYRNVCEIQKIIIEIAQEESTKLKVSLTAVPVM